MDHEYVYVLLRTLWIVVYSRAEETNGWNGSWITSLVRCGLWATGLLCGVRSGKPAAVGEAPSDERQTEGRD